MMMEKISSQVYYDPSSPVSYSGKEAVYKAAKALYPKITRRKVAIWQSKQFTYTLCTNKYFTTLKPKSICQGIDYQWQADLADLASVQKYNDS